MGPLVFGRALGLRGRPHPPDGAACALRARYRELLPRASYLELHVGAGDYLDELSRALGGLVAAHAISADEAALIMDRERQGDRLQLGHVAFPHTITPVAASTFRLLAIMPDAPCATATSRSTWWW